MHEEKVDFSDEPTPVDTTDVAVGRGKVDDPSTKNVPLLITVVLGDEAPSTEAIADATAPSLAEAAAEEIIPSALEKGIVERPFTTTMEPDATGEKVVPPTVTGAPPRERVGGGVEADKMDAIMLSILEIGTVDALLITTLLPPATTGSVFAGATLADPPTAVIVFPGTVTAEPPALRVCEPTMIGVVTAFETSAELKRVGLDARGASPLVVLVGCSATRELDGVSVEASEGLEVSRGGGFVVGGGFAVGGEVGAG
jgi:hypothetical protein